MTQSIGLNLVKWNLGGRPKAYSVHQLFKKFKLQEHLCYRQWVRSEKILIEKGLALNG